MKVIKGINKGDYLIMQTDKGEIQLGLEMNEESRQALYPYMLCDLGTRYFLPQRIASELPKILLQFRLVDNLLPAFHSLVSVLIKRISNGKEKLQKIDMKEVIRFREALTRLRRIKTKFPLDQFSLIVDNKKYTFKDQFILGSIWLPILMESNLPEIAVKDIPLFFSSQENVYHTMFQFFTQKLNLSEKNSYSLINKLYSSCGLIEHGNKEQVIDRWKKRIKRGTKA